MLNLINSVAKDLKAINYVRNLLEQTESRAAAALCTWNTSWCWSYKHSYTQKIHPVHSYYS